MVKYYGRTSIFIQFGFFCYYKLIIVITCTCKLLICSFKLLIWINKLITNLKLLWKKNNWKKILVVAQIYASVNNKLIHYKHFIYLYQKYTSWVKVKVGFRVQSCTTYPSPLFYCSLLSGQLLHMTCCLTVCSHCKLIRIKLKLYKIIQEWYENIWKVKVAAF